MIKWKKINESTKVETPEKELIDDIWTMLDDDWKRYSDKWEFYFNTDNRSFRLYNK